MSEEQNNPFAELGKAWEKAKSDIAQSWNESMASQKVVETMLQGIYEDAGKPYGDDLAARNRFYREKAEDIRRIVAAYWQQAEQPYETGLRES